jgi:crossover junction endodeoxyribonuclease RuvC
MASTGEGLILGVDPGLASSGWAVIDCGSRLTACGTVTTRPGPIAPRLSDIVSELAAVLARYEIGEAALEEVFLGRNATSAIAVAQARGAILVLLEQLSLRVYEYKPSQIKQVITGYGMADKAQMARMLALQVQVTGTLDDHSADAVAIALCHARSRRMNAAVASI